MLPSHRPAERNRVMAITRDVHDFTKTVYGAVAPQLVLMGGVGDRRDISGGSGFSLRGRTARDFLVSMGRQQSTRSGQATSSVRPVAQPAITQHVIPSGQTGGTLADLIGVAGVPSAPVPTQIIGIPEAGAPVPMQPVGIAFPGMITGTLNVSPGVYPDPDNPGRYVINAGGLQSNNLSLAVANRIASVTTGTVNAPVISGSGGGEVATDWGALLGNLATTYVGARYGGGGGAIQAQPAILPAIPGALALGGALGLGEMLGMDPSAGLGLPGVDIVRTDDFTKGKMYNPRTGKWVRCHRRRRKLLTDSDFKCLATLKTLTGNNSAFTAAVVRAVR